MKIVDILFYYKDSEGKTDSILEEADIDETLNEVIERTNVLSDMGTDSINKTKFIHDGKIINPFLTISHELSASNSEQSVFKVFLYYLKPAPVKKSRKQEFLEKLARSSKNNNDIPILSEHELQKMHFKEKREKQKMEEILRINDQIWSTWETSRDHDQIVQMMYEMQEEKFNEQDQIINGVEGEIEAPLNLSTATEISCDPLPNCFTYQNLNKRQILVSHCH